MILFYFCIFSFEKKNEEQTFIFTVYPPDQPDDSFLRPVATVNGKTYDPKLITNISLPPEPIAPVVPSSIDSSTLAQTTTTN